MPRLRPFATLPRRAWRRAQIEWVLRWQIPAYTTIEGWLTGYQAFGLYQLARRLPPGAVIVEVGSWKGRSTYCLARGLRAGRVIAIDPFDASGDAESAPGYSAEQGAQPLYDQFIANLTRLGVRDRVEARRGPSQAFAGTLPKCHLLFIDGDHSIAGARFDVEQLGRDLLPGGYLCLHDYDPARPDFGPTWVVEHLIVPSGQYRFVEAFGSLWVAQKHQDQPTS